MSIAPRVFFLLTCTAASSAALVVPNAAQLRYAESDFIALVRRRRSSKQGHLRSDLRSVPLLASQQIHYNMGTYAHNGDPCCDDTNWNVQADYAAGEVRII